MHSKKTIALWVFIFTLLLIIFGHRTMVMERSDFTAYYNAGKRALEFVSPSQMEETPFKYLPATSLVFAPLGALSFEVARGVFFVLNFLAFVLAYIWVIPRIGHKAALLLLAFCMRFHNYDFLNAQVNHILLLLYLFFLFYRDRYPISSSLAFTLLASFKVMPLVLLAPLLFMRQYKELGRILLMLVIISLIPGLFFKTGFQVYWDWFHLMFETTPLLRPEASILQSIPGALLYWFDRWVPLWTVWTLAAAIFVGLLYLSCKMATNAKTSEDQGRAFASAMVFAIVASPLAWKHNYLLLFPGMIFLIQVGRKNFLLFQFILMTVIPTLLALIVTEWSDRSYLLVIGAVLIFFELLSRQHPRASIEKLQN